MAKSKGFCAGPRCKACEKEHADNGQVFCYKCRQRINDADRYASNADLIRQDMLEAGVPVVGYQATFNPLVRGASAHVRNRGTNLMAALFDDSGKVR
jgi:tRNA(Ile2) C34 agmatinyltransferase TiaS